MLKFLTHKLRTHSLNEENVTEKAEERDSGTESDDEAERASSTSAGIYTVNGPPALAISPPPTKQGEICSDVTMKWNDDVTDISMGGEACACAPSPARLPPHPEPDHLYDHHSSEEELEVINGVPRASEACVEGAGESRRRGASSPPPAAPEKKRWPRALPAGHDTAHDDDDDDDDDTKVETPVRFRTSPPLEALKPRRAACLCRAALPPRPRPAPAAASPRRRRGPLPPPRRHRPALDFDKMQQLKVGGGDVRSWRAAGPAGELSVYCW